MNTIKQQGRLSHHAYMVAGEEGKVLPELVELLESVLSFPTTGNPDFWYGSFDVFGVDDGRELKVMQAGFSVLHDKRVFVLCARSFTDQAQNALLRVLEEPTAGVYFFLITPNTELLLPTLRSRLFELTPFAQFEVSRTMNQSAMDFLEMKKATRLVFAEKIAKEKDKAGATLFLNALEYILEKKLTDAFSREKVAVSLREIAMGKKYLSRNGASLKIILEHIALAI